MVVFGGGEVRLEAAPQRAPDAELLRRDEGLEHHLKREEVRGDKLEARVTHDSSRREDSGNELFVSWDLRSMSWAFHVI